MALENYLFWPEMGSEPYTPPKILKSPEKFLHTVWAHFLIFNGKILGFMFPLQGIISNIRNLFDSVIFTLCSVSGKYLYRDHVCMSCSIWDALSFF